MRASKTAGFTLLEMIAALGVFSVVIVIFSSTFLSFLNAERKSQISANVHENLRFAVEVMAKEIRTGAGYGFPDPTDPSFFTFSNAEGEPIAYRAGDPEADSRCPALERRSIERSEDGGTTFAPLTSDQVCVNRLEFLIAGIQPRVQILVNATAKIQNVETALTIQTLVSQRKVATPE